MPSSSKARRLVLLGGVALGTTLLHGAGCNGGAVGVDACIEIEQARCGLAPKCAGIDKVPEIKTPTEVANCKILYRDHCRVGLENTVSAEPAKGTIDACVAALTAAVACHTQGLATMFGCLENGQQIGVADFTLSPCATLETPQNLTACNFIETPPTTSTTAAATTATTAATTTSTTTSSTTGGGGSGG